MSLKRKCACCNEQILISKRNIDECIYYDKKTYHSKCFVNMCKSRSKVKRTAEKWTLIYDNYNDIKHKSIDHYLNQICKDEIFELITTHYDIVNIPSGIWNRLSSIYNGEYKGLTVGIPPKHLLDMWNRKMDVLDKIANQNITKGKVMSKEQRIIYDIAILVNKYDSYLTWLNEQKILASENKTEDIKHETINDNYMRVLSKQNNNNKNNELLDIVDDIFDDGE